MMCATPCSHGGLCSLEPGHDGLHDASGYCQWSDEDSITRAEADAILAGKGPEGLLAVIRTAGITREET